MNPLAEFIATSLVSGPTLDPTPTSYDLHDYRSPCKLMVVVDVYTWIEKLI